MKWDGIHSAFARGGKGSETGHFFLRWVLRVLRMTLLLYGIVFVSFDRSCAQLPQPIHKITFKYAHQVTQSEYILLGDTLQRRPLLVFIAGSSPSPLFIEAGGKVYPVYVPFDERVLGNAFQLLVLNKQGVPLICKESELDESGNLSKLDGAGDLTYFQHCNTLGFQVAAHEAALNKVLKMNCVDARKVVVIGHSQGARVATELARKHRAITHLAYLSCDPQGRMSDQLRRELASVPETFEYDSLLQTMAPIKGNKVRLPIDHPDYGTLTFSRNLLPILANLKIPLFVGYGTADPACVDCAEIAVACARTGKRSLRMHVIVGVEHNFMGLGTDGRVDANQFHWDEVAKAIVDWVGKQ